MKFKKGYINCVEQVTNSKSEVQEIFNIISAIPWKASRVEAVSKTGNTVYWQKAYNRIFEINFEELLWEIQPKISLRPLHKADFAKNNVFVEIQFGNSSTVYLDFYKFHYGFINKLLDLGVLIVPTNQHRFFPQRNPKSIDKMATFEYALDHLIALTIPVPILLIGLLPEN